MSDFQHFTRGQSSSQGKPRVYFTAHPDDYKTHFETIRKEILDRQNCAVFFLDGQTKPDEIDDYELCLKEMQLFVVPITSKLLTSHNRAMDNDIPFAIEHHIPVLPLMQEGGLDELFVKKFGDLQYLDKNNIDPTAISYDKKLTNYLESVIVGDELAKKVRAAFDAYIFMSYRKKDRKYAQKLMSLIHSNQLCRDIAIWYDEFLTPGEDFNEAIREVLEKCDLFTLVVTPNLINELNYVLSIEYPMAKKLGKEVLPAELIPTDRDKLSEMYEGIPEPVKAEDSKKLNEQLIDLVHRLAVTVNDSDPTHSFFIGLAYLSGIDVEVDHERAVELITASANAHCTEAIKKLVTMYSIGDAVKRDTETAIEWQMKLVEHLTDRAEKTYSEDDAFALLQEKMILGEMAYSDEVYDLAQKEFSVSYGIAKQLSFGAIGKTFFGKVKVLFNKYMHNNSYYNESVLYLAKACRMMLETAYAMGLSDSISEWSQKAMLIVRTVNKQFSDSRTAVELISLGTKIAKECIASGNLTGAMMWLNACTECRDNLDEEEITLEVRIAYSYYFDSYTEYCIASADYAGSYDSQETRKRYLLELHEEFPENHLIRYELINCILTEADICIHCSDLVSAEKLTDTAKELIDYEAKEGNYKIRVMNSKYLLYRGIIAYNKGYYQEASDHLLQCIGILRPITETKFDANHKRQLACAYEKLGDCCYSIGKYADAEDWHNKAVDETAGVVTFSKAIKDSRFSAVLHEKLINDCIACGKLFSVSEHYENALWFRKVLVQGVQVKSGFGSKELSKLVKSGRLDSSFYNEDVEALETLEKRENEILSICTEVSKAGNKLIDNMRPLSPDTRIIIDGIRELIELFLQTHSVIEIRNELKHLEYTLSKINRFSELFDNKDVMLAKYVRCVNSIQAYISRNMIPFFKYDEEGILIMTFCKFMSICLMPKTEKGREKEQEEFAAEFMRSVFWDYPVNDIKYLELWQQLNALLKQHENSTD